MRDERITLPDVCLRGHGAIVVRFTFAFVTDSLPVVYVCPTPNCESLAWFHGVEVKREGYVTCGKCVRPMQRAECTVH